MNIQNVALNCISNIGGNTELKMQGGALRVELVLSGFSQRKFLGGLCAKNSG